MKIVMLTTNSSLMDGINRHILTIAPQLNRLDGCEVAVCTVFPRGELNEELEVKGVKSYSLNASSGHDLKIIARFFKILHTLKPDIIHSHVMALFERVLLSVCFRKLKYVNTIHGISDKVEHETVRMKLERCLNTIFSINYNAQCVVSNGVKQYLLGDKATPNIHVVYNPLCFKKPTPKEYKLHALLGVEKNTPIVGTACRFAAVKNPVMFTRVLSQVLQRNEKAHAVVMGDGDETLKNELARIVAASHVESRFHWLGYRQDAPALICDLDCFVMTSLSEGMPTSILESMANKTPFAMMEGEGGLRDIADINDKEGPIGIVVPKDDMDGMAHEIASLIDHKERQNALAERAYSVGRRYFDVESVCNNIYHIYKSVCERSSNI